MFEVLEGVPAHRPSSAASQALTKEAYDNTVSAFTQHLKRAFQLYEAWWKSGDDLLYDMSLEEILKARRFMESIVIQAGDKVAERLSKRATFMFDLAACMGGLTGTEG